MRDAGLAFGILTQKFELSTFLDFLISETCIKEIKMIYAEFMTLLSLLKGTIKMNQNSF